MDRMTITQEYLMLASNEKGKMSLMNGTESKAGIVVAGMMDLVLSNAIKIDQKKTEVVGELPEGLSFLSSLYGYLQEKKRSVTKVVEDYCLSMTDSKWNQLTADTGESLVKIGSATEEKGGLLGGKKLFIPSEVCKEELIDSLKTEVIQKEALTLHDIVLVTLLKETKCLKQYFSKHETGILKERLEAMKDDPDSKAVKEMAGYIDEVMTAMIAAASAAVN